MLSFHPTVEQLESCVGTMEWFSARARQEIQYHTSVTDALKETRELVARREQPKRRPIDEILPECYELRTKKNWAYVDLGARFGYSQELIRTKLAKRYPDIQTRTITRNPNRAPREVSA